MAAETFETLRTFDGAPALLDAHLARLGAADDRALRQQVIERVAAAEGDVVVRILGGEIELRPLPAEPQSPIDLRTADVPGYSYPQKSTDRAVHERLLERAGTFDVLILDDGEVIEGAITNVFARFGNKLKTPPLGRCLPGITRAALIELAPAAGLAAEETPLTLDQLFAADEVLLTNSLRGVLAADSIDGRPVGGGGPAMAEQLAAALQDHYRQVHDRQGQ